MQVEINRQREASFPGDQVIGVFEGIEGAQAVCDELGDSVPGEADILSGIEGLAIFDPDGEHQDRAGRRARHLQHLGSAENELYVYADALKDGHAVLRIPSAQGDAETMAQLLHRHGGYHVAFQTRHSLREFPRPS